MKIITVGKKLDSNLKEAVFGYSKRLQGRFGLDWVFLPNSSAKNELARSSESKAILAVLRPTDFVVLLDERGKNISSPELAQLLEVNLGKEVVFVIGGAYGVDDDLRMRANFVWSLSKLVLPHQIVRLVLTEQIYRSQAILAGHPYHHQ